MTDTCENCKFFNEHKQMANGSYLCNFHQYTTKPSNRGCYKIQYNKISNEKS